MVKTTKGMLKISRFFLLLLLFNTLLFSGVNTLQKAVVEKGELRLFFSNSFNKNDLTHLTLRNPHREIYDFKNTRLGHDRIPLGLGIHVRISQYKVNTVRIVIDGYPSFKAGGYQPFYPDNHYYIALPKNGKAISAQLSHVAPVQRYQKPKSYPEEVGIPVQNSSAHSKLIVIDAGHGGQDAGAVVGGKREKDVVLQIAKRLEKELKKRGHPVYMTRTTDRFLKLPQRTKIADQKESAAFISIHANSVAKKSQNKVQGVETFFLQKTRDARSKRIAERENKSVLQGTTQLSRNIILDSVLSGPKIVQSNKLAIDVQRRILTNVRSKYSGVKDGGVRHAPFWVLVGASRPSILVEVGYISHPLERERLCNPHYQNLIAQGIAEGVDNYLSNRKKEIDF